MPQNAETENLAHQLFPLGPNYKLENGETIRVQKWSISTLVRFTQRVPDVAERFVELAKSDPDAPVTKILPSMIDEVIEVVSESTGCSPETIRDEWTAEDLIGVSCVVWDYCVAGLLAKSVGLTARLGSLMAAPTKSPAGTSSKPSATSANEVIA